MKKHYRTIAVLMVLLLMMNVCVLAGCGTKSKETGNSSSASASPPESEQTEKAQAGTSSDKRMFTDMTGAQVELPKEIKSIIHLWPASTALQVFLGEGDKITGTLAGVQKGWGWLTTACPHLLEVTGFTGDATAEELLALNPDVVITSNSNTAAALREKSVPCICMLGSQETIKSLKEYVMKMGELLGDNAKSKATQYCDYLDGVVKKVSDATGTIPAEKRVSIYYNSAQKSGSPLFTCGDDYITQTWMDIISVDNIAKSLVTGGDKEISMEEIIKANPEYIIIGGSNQTQALETIRSDKSWQSLSAVADGKIIMNPQGVMKWEKFGVEIALQLVWITKELYPGLLNDVDVKQTVLDFYSNYYGMKLTDAQYSDLMSGAAAPQS